MRILEEEKNFFQSLYCRGTTTQPLESLDQLNLNAEDVPQLSQLDRDRLDNPYSPEELKNALGKLNKGKCPGSDGLTVELYERFWQALQEPFCEAIFQALGEGILSVEQRRGVISLIPKKNSDRRYVANWRPITLLNTDYKILTKAIAIRMQSCIKQIIHTDQNGFLRGRYIGSNLRTVQDIIDKTQDLRDQDSEPFILALDYEKAFDSISWQTIFKALEFFGFGDEFLKSIRTLFNGPQSCVINAGFTSPYFLPTNGVRQGCCASPLLFVVAVELMATMVRQNTNIRGINIWETEHKISQFADGTTCFVGSRDSGKAAIQTIQLFSRFSGLRLNKNKSMALPIGSHDSTSDSFCGLKCVQKVNILGIWVSNKRSLDDHYRWNFAPALQKIQACCDSWANRSLSLKGKVTVYNSLMISLLQYLVANTVTPPRVFREVKKMACAFLWSQKKNKVVYGLVIQAIADGGLRLMDLQSRTEASMLSCIRRILANPRETSAEYLREILHEQDLKLILASKRSFSGTIRLRSPFYSEVLHTWEKFHNVPPQDEQEIRREVLWYNCRIGTKADMLTRPRWNHFIEKEIFTVGQICHPSDNRLLGQTELEDTFAIRTNFLETLALRNSVPHAWRGQITQNFDGDGEVRFEVVILDKKMDITKRNQKECYNALVAAKTQPNPRVESWNRELALSSVDGNAPHIMWDQAFAVPYKTCRETKLQAFHYRIMQRIITCNSYLHKIKIKQSPECSFCAEEDSISHFFVTCDKVKVFWNSLNDWCIQHIDLPLAHLSIHEVLLGLTRDIGNPTAQKVTNWILLCAKFYLHRQKLFHAGEFSLLAFLRETKRKLETERLACIMENTRQKFRAWQRLFDALTA